MILDGKETDDSRPRPHGGVPEFLADAVDDRLRKYPSRREAAFADWPAQKISDYVQRYINMVGLTGAGI